MAVCSVRTGLCCCVRVSRCHGPPLPPDQVLSSLGLLLLLISGVFGTTSLQTETLSSQHRAQTSRLVTSADTDTGDMGTWGHDDMCLVSSLVTGRGHTADWGLQAAAAAAWAWLPRPQTSDSRACSYHRHSLTLTSSRALYTVHPPLYRPYMYSVYCVVAAGPRLGLLARTPSTRPVCPE